MVIFIDDIIIYSRTQNKEIPLVKIQRDESHSGDATWELESEMREAYPHLFQVIFKFEDEFYLMEEVRIPSVSLNTQIFISRDQMSSYVL